MTTKIAIIGCGAVAELFHIPASLKLLGASNVFLVDSDLSRLRTVARKFNDLPTAPSLFKLNTSLDAVIIATPPHTHFRLALEAFAQGLHVLCEKPLANTLAECRAMIAGARAANLCLAVGHTYRLFPNRIRLRAMIHAGELGSIRSVDIEQGDPPGWDSATGYAFQKELVPGGVLLIEGLHSIDFLLWCFGPPRRFDYIDDALGGIESNARLILDFAPGFQAGVRVSRTFSLANTISIQGDRAAASLRVYDMNTLTLKSRGREQTLCCGAANSDFETIAQTQLNDFICACSLSRTPFCSGEQGAMAIELIEACYRTQKARPLPAKAPPPGLMW